MLMARFYSMPFFIFDIDIDEQAEYHFSSVDETAGLHSLLGVTVVTDVDVNSPDGGGVGM